MPMFSVIRHECGSPAYLVGQQLVYGWNVYCCNQCGEAFHIWVSREMLEQETLEMLLTRAV